MIILSPSETDCGSGGKIKASVQNLLERRLVHTVSYGSEALDSPILCSKIKRERPYCTAQKVLSGTRRSVSSLCKSLTSSLEVLRQYVGTCPYLEAPRPILYHLDAAERLRHAVPGEGLPRGEPGQVDAAAPVNQSQALVAPRTGPAGRPVLPPFTAEKGSVVSAGDSHMQRWVSLWTMKLTESKLVAPRAGPPARPVLPPLTAEKGSVASTGR